MGILHSAPLFMFIVKQHLENWVHFYRQVEREIEEHNLMSPLEGASLSLSSSGSWKI
jgi:hypothetical protein